MADVPADLSPFRSLVSFSSAVQYAWYMDYDYSHTHEGISTNDEALRDERYAQYVEWYGDDPDHFVEKWDEGTAYHAAVYHVVRQGTLKLDEPEDWSPLPYDDDYYAQYFDANTWNNKHTAVLNVEWRNQA